MKYIDFTQRAPGSGSEGKRLFRQLLAAIERSAYNDSIMVDFYRAFTRFTRWYLRFVTSAVAGLFAATALCLGGARLLGSGNDVMSVLFVLAIPLWLIVSVISYKALKPETENRE